MHINYTPMQGFICNALYAVQCSSWMFGSQLRVYCTRIHTHMHAYTRAYMQANIRAFMQANMQANIHIHTFIHADKHTHTLNNETRPLHISANPQ